MSRFRRLRGLLAVAALVAVPRTAGASPSPEGAWTLVGNPYRSRVELTWFPEHGTMVAHVGCRETTYAVNLKEAVLSLDEGLVHEGACFHQENRNPQVRAYWSSLDRQIATARAVRVAGDRLLLSPARGRTLTFVRQSPAAP